MIEPIQALMSKVERLGGEKPRPASTGDLKRAEEAGFPPELIDFYRDCEPAGCIEFKQRLWSIEWALIENTDAIPGYMLSPHGFIVFASNTCGDSYCIDTNTITPDGRHPVVFFSHEEVSEDTSLSEILSLRVEVARSLEEFLVKFTNETLVDNPENP